MTEPKYITPPGLEPDPARGDFQFLEDLATAHWYSEVLFASLELDLFSLLGHGQALARQDLIQQTGWDPDALDRLLEALKALGLVLENEYGLTNSPLAQRFLVKDGERFLGDFLAYRRYIAPSWRKLPDRVRLGREANRRREEEAGDDYQKRVAAYVKALDAQAGLKVREALSHLEHLLPAPPAKILDLGGGAGAWSRALTRHWPDTEAVLFDLPEVIAAAGEIYPDPAHWQGIERIGGDCLRPCLASQSFDLIILSNLLHAYGRQEALAILRQARGWLAPGGGVLIHDYLLEGHPASPLKGRLYDLHMLLNTYNGRIFGLDELQDLAREAGLYSQRSLHLPSDSSLLLAWAKPGQTEHLDEFQLLLGRVKALGFAQAAPISPNQIPVKPWVRQKCATGCARYGRSLQCPPHSPDEARMQAILSSYERAILLQGEPPGKEFHQKLLAAERLCFLAGHHKALAFGAGPCTLCDQCGPNRPCLQPDKARPALEACGVDVYACAEQAGWSLEPVQTRDGYVKYLGLVLVD